MQRTITIGSFLLGATIGAVVVLSVRGGTPNALPNIPTARHYSIQVGNTGYFTKSLKVDGNWIVFETEQGTIITPSSSVVAITAHPVK